MSMTAQSEHIVPDGYLVNEHGVWRLQGEKRPRLRLTTTSVFVTALLRDVNASGWSVEIEFSTPDGETRRLLIPYARLGRRDLSQEVTEQGLLVLPRAEYEFPEYLAQCAGNPKLPRHRLTTKLGLNVLPDAVEPERLAFVLPTQTLLPANLPTPSERLTFRPPLANPVFAAYSSAGDLAQSQETLALVRDDPIAIFVCCASLAAPFLEAAGVDSIIVHLYGKSSSGKTTRLQLCAMLWGTPLDPQAAGNALTLIERWHGTANSMENLAATHNGMVLCLDELGGNTDQAFSVYNQTAGRGKNRMSRDGGIQTQRQWSLLSMSSGELSLTDRLEANSGKPAKTGEIIRGLSIPLDGLPAYDSLDPEAASRHVQMVKTRCSQAYGTIGPAFAQYVIDTFGTSSELREQLHAHIEDHHNALIELAHAKGLPLEAPHIRALRRFALMRVAGVWAADDYLPFSEEEVTDAVDLVTLVWLASLPVLNDEDRIVGQIRDWVIRHQGQMIRYDEQNDTPYVPSVSKGIRHQRWILLTEADFAEACTGTSTTVAGKLLKRLGILDGEEGKHKKRHLLSHLGLPSSYFYSIVLKKLLPEAERKEAQASAPSTLLPPRPHNGAKQAHNHLRVRGDETTPTF